MDPNFKGRKADPVTHIDDNSFEQQAFPVRAVQGRHSPSSKKKLRRRILISYLASAAILISIACALWLGSKANEMKTELQDAVKQVPTLKSSVLSGHSEDAALAFASIKSHTSSARQISEDPVWTTASNLPWIGANFAAASEVARSSDDIATSGIGPLVQVASTLDWRTLVPGASERDLAAVAKASPRVVQAAHAVQISTERLESIRTGELLPQLAVPLSEVLGELRTASQALNAAADVSQLAPGMLGGSGKRSYLLIIQNNAEARSSGGIPGAAAVLTLEEGKVSLGVQSSASDVGIMSPPVPVDSSQQHIYSSRIGKYMQDANLTPDFPTTGLTVQTMWERKTGSRVDGVLSIDPIVLSYIIKATGPVSVNGTELAAFKAAGMPTELTADNVVQALLSDAYAKITDPRLQDVYFAGVAKEIFSALTDGKAEANAIIDGLSKGAAEGRVLLWSADAKEQSLITKYSLSGAIEGPSVSPAQFGVYFNDGTGAKMDYYVKRTVQLVKECPADGYQQTRVRVTSMNSAPADAATSLPAYVTGGGAFGVPPGTVQTNIAAYGPVQANVESATINGQKIPFAPYLHANRPVGVVAQQLAPGESQTVEFTFGKIVQHTEPNVVVTPTVQHVKDVILPTENVSCDQAQ